MDDIQHFKVLLNKGLYPHNLVDLEKFCNTKVKACEKNFVGWYVLENIFFTLRDMWDFHKPLIKTESDRINSMLLEPIDNLLDLLIAEEKGVDMIRQLENIIKNYLELNRTFRK